MTDLQLRHKAMLQTKIELGTPEKKNSVKFLEYLDSLDKFQFEKVMRHTQYIANNRSV